jgi:hypothetical protein
MDGATEFTGRHIKFIKEAQHSMRIMLCTHDRTRKKESESRGGTRNWLPSEKMEAKDDEATSTQRFMGLRSHLQERVVMPYGT